MDRAQLSESDSTNRDRVSAVRLGAVGSVVGLVPTAYAALRSNSAALLADFIRCAGESLAILVSWWVLTRVARGACPLVPNGCGVLEKRAQRVVGLTLTISSCALVWVSVLRFLSPAPLEKALFGCILAVISVIANGYLWLRYAALARKDPPSAVMEAQWRLFRAKTAATVVVALSVGGALLFPQAQWSALLDPIGSAAVGVFLGVSGIRLIVTAHRDLLPNHEARSI